MTDAPTDPDTVARVIREGASLARQLSIALTNVATLTEDLRLAMAANTRLRAEVERLETRDDRREEALQRIVRWSEAYPLEVFPEPDMAYARALLARGGITLDAVSASAMRHVLKGAADIARKGLE
jgi:hypothetical protein